MNDEVGYLVSYGKFVDDKTEGIYLENIYLGGVANSIELAEQLASSCTREVKGGSVFPYIVEITSPIEELIESIRDKFLKMEMSMIEAEDQMAFAKEVAKRNRR